jgi:hypothetical protein
MLKRKMTDRALRMNSLYKTEPYKKAATGTNRRAVALVLTLVVLVVLTTIVYALASRVAQARHRRQYLIDYQISRYACDSGAKYALAAIKEMDFKLINRKNKPDFSDVFTMGREEYELYLDEWALKLAQQAAAESTYGAGNESSGRSLDADEGIAPGLSNNSTPSLLGELKKFLDDPNSGIDPNFLTPDYTEPNAVFIPGPYGPEWPHVCDPIKFEIGQTNVTIEITDENAKMPLTWLVAENDQVRKLAGDALDTFGAWMQMDPVEIRMLSEQLEDVEDIKRFTINPKSIPIKETVKTPVKSNTSRRRTSPRRPSPKKPVRPAISHTTDFAKLLHGSAIDFEVLTRPLPDTGDRDESPLKYLGMWGSHKVNINTAPRHVLEALFTFGGDAEDIADEIIQRRHEKPFKDIKDLEESLYRYSESIRKVKAGDCITTSSRFFAIKITAAHGRAETQAVATVIKEKKKIVPVAIISQL